MTIEFRKPTAEETRTLAEALRKNGKEGIALRMDALTTGWIPGNDEVTEDEVITAIQSVPCHYAGYGPIFRDGKLIGFAPPGSDYPIDQIVIAEDTTGQTCVGDLRLTPLDVGFDVRLHDMAVELPAQFESVGIAYRGRTYLLRGNRDGLVAAIQAAGYTIGGEA